MKLAFTISLAVYVAGASCEKRRPKHWLTIQKIFCPTAKNSKAFEQI
jgi:hypothetical protein